MVANVDFIIICRVFKFQPLNNGGWLQGTRSGPQTTDKLVKFTRFNGEPTPQATTPGWDYYRWWFVRWLYYPLVTGDDHYPWTENPILDQCTQWNGGFEHCSAKLVCFERTTSVHCGFVSTVGWVKLNHWVQVAFSSQAPVKPLWSLPIQMAIIYGSTFHIQINVLQHQSFTIDNQPHGKWSINWIATCFHGILVNIDLSMTIQIMFPIV